ncbi:MAG TPA: aminotransferase class III-fold pyridoxal phosphate-dependent enzyme [Gaiellales bacterium]|jgi:adenosylmethionine-8-amino-7-oxononanoate aminotransferase
MTGGRVDPVLVHADGSAVFHRELDRGYPLIVRGEGMWLVDEGGNRYLDAVGGGAMVASLGAGVPEIAAAAHRQLGEIGFIYNQQFTSPAQEELARRLTGLAPGFSRVHFASGGAEANETLLRLARAYHVERGERERWNVISFAQAYHGPTMATLALTGRPGLQHPNQPYLPGFIHVPPPTRRFDPSGDRTIDAIEQAIQEHGSGTIAAFFCEAVSAAAMPAFRAPDSFWERLGDLRTRHGFLVCLDEVVTGMGRTGTWFHAQQLPIDIDILSTAKGLGAGYAPVAAVLCREHVYAAVASGSRSFELGHTWDGAPLSCAVGLAVIDYIETHRLVERVAERGSAVRAALEEELRHVPMVAGVRGQGFLFGVEYADPDDSGAFLDPALGVAQAIDQEALRRGLVVYSTQPTRDGYAGDQTLLAPAFTATDAELEAMVERLGATVRAVSAKTMERSLT